MALEAFWLIILPKAFARFLMILDIFNSYIRHMCINHIKGEDLISFLKSSTIFHFGLSLKAITKQVIIKFKIPFTITVTFTTKFNIISVNSNHTVC